MSMFQFFFFVLFYTSVNLIHFDLLIVSQKKMLKRINFTFGNLWVDDLHKLINKINNEKDHKL